MTRATVNAIGLTMKLLVAKMNYTFLILSQHLFQQWYWSCWAKFSYKNHIVENNFPHTTIEEEKLVNSLNNLA